MDAGTTFTAPPASIGAVNRGVTPQVIRKGDGVLVYGEDFVSACSGLSSGNTSWATVAGFPLSPYSFGLSSLSDFCRTYKEWRFVQAAVCFVPAVATSANGQVALYRKFNRADPHVDPTGSSFFGYVLSQKTGVIGPVWQPQGMMIPVSDDWRSTVPLEAININDECDGEVFCATNNNVNSGTSPSIGILKLQYVCEFRGMARNPRTSLLPCPNQIYFNTSLGRNGASVAPTGVVTVGIFGNDQTGNPATLVSSQRGDVFKFIVDMGRSSFGAASPNTLLAESYSGGTQFPYTLENGSTLYVWYDGNAGPTSFVIFRNLAAALAGNPMNWGLTSASLTFNLVGMMSLVASTSVRGNLDI